MLPPPSDTALGRVGAGLLGVALLHAGVTFAGGRGQATGEGAELGRVRGALLSTERIRSRGVTSEADLVVYLVPVGGKPEKAPDDRRVEVEQVKREFLPHVLAVQIGTEVLFTNADAIRHNILANDACCTVDLDLEEGEESSVRIEDPCVATIICRIHPEMSMFIVAVPSPHFTQVRLESEKNERGDRVYRAEYAIDGVPPGEYVLHAWSKKLAARKVKVSVASGAPTVLDLDW